MMSDDEKAFREEIGGIKDWWLGDNKEWQTKLGENDKALGQMFKVDLKILFLALDTYAVKEQELKDEIEYLRNKYGC